MTGLDRSLRVRLTKTLSSSGSVFLSIPIKGSVSGISRVIKIPRLGLNAYVKHDIFARTVIQIRPPEKLSVVAVGGKTVQGSIEHPQINTQE